MRITRAATIVHKWLALLMAVQILLWMASGLFFAVFPIEEVRSEHRIADHAAEPVPLGVSAAGLQRLAATGMAGETVEIAMRQGTPVARVTADGKTRVFDLATAKPLSAIDAAEARAIASAETAGHPKAAASRRITRETTEYRGALPAWRVDFADGYSVYVAADTGKVTARRSDLWRAYDLLWALHIMDYEAHEDFNTPLLIAAAVLGLVVVLSGIVMLPSRFGIRLRRAS